ncbi:hypothetical protein TNCV_2598201 [Trichonephila clavipes]|nr:hypothetical protein TNCV_2598201 [Trichonephila clavipes]
MEIRTSSSDNNSSSYKSNNFEGMQSKLNESQYSRKNGPGERRELEGKGTGLSRRIRVRGTRVLPVIADHLSDHHLALGRNQIERLKKVERKLSYISDPSIPVTTTCDQEEVQRYSPDQPMRRGHNKKDQFDPEEAERNNSTAPTPRGKEDQAAGIQEAEEVSNNIARRGREERSVKNPTHLKS